MLLIAALMFLSSILADCVGKQSRCICGLSLVDDYIVIGCAWLNGPLLDD